MDELLTTDEETKTIEESRESALDMLDQKIKDQKDYLDLLDDPGTTEWDDGIKNFIALYDMKVKIAEQERKARELDMQEKIEKRKDCLTKIGLGVTAAIGIADIILKGWAYNKGYSNERDNIYPNSRTHDIARNEIFKSSGGFKLFNKK